MARTKNTRTNIRVDLLPGRPLITGSGCGCCSRRAAGRIPSKYPVHTKSLASKLSEDVISNMPDNVITNILNHLPIQNAVGTSILSKNWRFKWTTMLTQLVFDEDFFWNLDENYHGRIIISRILLLHKHTIIKFSIDIKDQSYFEDIGNWVMFLSQKEIEEFTLLNLSGEELMLPTHLFSCQKLKHLKLQNCCFPLVSSSCGFPNLLSLELHKVRDAGDKYGEFLNQSPLLETLKITGNSLESSSIFQLLGLFPKLQELTLDSSICKVEQIDEDDISSRTTPPSRVHPTIAGQLQLQKVVFKDLEGSENELCSIKAILSGSPMLKKMDAFINYSTVRNGGDVNLMLTSMFLNLHQAYPKVKIVLH